MEEPARDHGTQPLEALMTRRNLSNHELVEASPEQLNHKQVQKARKGRQLTLPMMQKVARSLNIAIWSRLKKEEKEAFAEYQHRHLRGHFLQYVLRCARSDREGWAMSNRSLAASLRAARNRLGLTPAAIAEVLGVTEQTFHTWESGKRNPLKEAFERIGEVLGIPPSGA